jgi:hypothetical protein
MRPACKLCGKRPSLRRLVRYCLICHDRSIRGCREYPLPDGHPFTEERRQRVERMRQRAQQRLPIFEEVHPDLT